MSRKKTWQEKLADDRGLPRIELIGEKMVRRWGEGTLVIPAPREVDELMKRVSAGRLTTITEIRTALAQKHGATIGCPLTTGIFAWVAAHAAEEEAELGKSAVTPFWRTLKTGGELNPKYPGGLERQKRLLEAEGHRVIRKGERFVVPDYSQHLADLRPPEEDLRP